MMILQRGRIEHLDAVMHLQAESNDAPHWGRSVYERTVQGSSSEVSSDKSGLQRVLIVAQTEELQAGGSGAVCGFAVAVVSCDEAELESVVVAAEQRRHGMGSLLCLAVMDWARDAGALRIRLEARASNAAAQSLYRSLGFVQAGLRRGYYSAPLEDAVQMAVELRAVDL